MTNTALGSAATEDHLQSFGVLWLHVVEVVVEMHAHQRRRDHQLAAVLELIQPTVQEFEQLARGKCSMTCDISITRARRPETWNSSGSIEFRPAFLFVRTISGLTSIPTASMPCAARGRK